MPQLTLHLLGPPQIKLKGSPLVIDRRKVIALLVYLALSPYPQPRDNLATLFWPDYDQQSARNNLRRTLSVLKQALEDRWLHIEREQIALKQDEGLWLDVVEFRHLRAACERHGHPTTEVCSACLPLLAEAVDLYRGDFLTGFTLQDSPDFDDWQLFQAERLRQELAETLAYLAQGYATQGEFKTALTYAQRWLNLDSLHEPAHRQLMQLYAQAGDRAAALRQYQACVDMLQTELGLPPSPETIQLYEIVKLTPGSKGASERKNEEVIQNRHNLPLQLTPLLGREAELRELARLLAEPDLRLITLVGPGGIGKTHLALEAARNQLERFPHGVYFVSLASLDSPQAMIAATAKALNFAFYDKSSPQQQLCDYLRQKSLLLVMDNFEHLLTSSSSSLQGQIEDGSPGVEDLVVEWLQTAPGLKLLVTSRVKLNMLGEQCFPLNGLTFPHSEVENNQKLTRYSAIQLFLQAARWLHPQFDLAEDEALAVAHICRLMQGMPLGILLAAAWVDLLKPSEIARQIGQSLDFLVSDWRNLPERQRSLRAVFDHSWRLLAEREQTIFQQISVFRGGFTYEAAQVVTGASLLELRALVNKSLLRHLETGRYELHELLWQYGAEKLKKQTAEVSETSAVLTSLAHHVRDRHSTYYCALLQAWEADLKGARQQLALAEIEVEHENIRLAWSWATEQGQAERLAQAMDSLGLFYDWQGRFQEGEIAFRAAAEQLATTISTEGLLILARLLAWRALFCRRLGQTEWAGRLLQESLTYLNRNELAHQNIVSEKAFVLFELGDYLAYTAGQEAGQLLEQSLILYRSLEDRWGTARALAALGELASESGSLVEAVQRFQESLALRQELGDQRGVADTLAILGTVVRHQGQLERSEQLQRQSLAIFEQLDNQANIARIYHDLGLSLCWLGRFSEAVSMSEKSLVIYSNLGHRLNIAWTNESLSYAELYSGRYEQARAHIQLALTFFHQTGDQRALGGSFITQGNLALIEEDYAEAQQFLQESVAIFRRIGFQMALGYALANLGGVECYTCAFQQAHHYLLESLQIAIETEVFTLLHETSAFVALFLAKQKQPERAVELYALASRFPHIGNSPWFEDVIGRHIVTAAANLPPEVVSAAQERGRKRDAWATAVELLAELEALH